MLRYIIYRLVQLIPVMLLVSCVVFAFMHVLPGDVIDALAGEGALRPARLGSGGRARIVYEQEELDRYVKKCMRQAAIDVDSLLRGTRERRRE